MDKKTIAHVLFQFGVCVSFFSFLYFTWVQKITHLIVERQINDVFSSIEKDLRLIDVDNTLRSKIYYALKNKLAQMRMGTTNADTTIEATNTIVKIEAGLTIGIFVLIVFGICGYLVKRYKLNATDMIVDGLSGMFILSGVLIAFLYLVVMNYNLIDPNVVKKMMVDAWIEYSSGKK